MTVDIDTSNLPEAVGERHIMQPLEELRVEVPYGTQTQTASFILQKGSCELWGCELALGKQYSIATGGLKIALFTWHGTEIWIRAVHIRFQTMYKVKRWYAVHCGVVCTVQHNDNHRPCIK